MLTQAHQGYYYQDILGAYLLAKDIANGYLDSLFRFDKKEAKGDRFDDIVITRNGRIFRNQVKYSNNITDHQLCKDDLANGAGYGLALSDLFVSWKSSTNKDEEFRICLSWRAPNIEDKISKILIRDTTSIKNFSTSILYRIDPEKLWPKGEHPLKGWQKFRRDMSAEDRIDFLQFCNQLILEVELPKASTNLLEPDKIETELLEMVSSIGIGVFPNEELNPRMVASYLIGYVRQQRMNNELSSFEVTPKNAADHAQIQLEFGAIEQEFPVIASQLVQTEASVELTVKMLELHSKIIITGAPGSGKSWMINNLETKLSDKWNVIKHYCYTSIDDILQSKRILVNTLYGNIIHQLVERFDELHSKKVKRYAANLPELNNLISEITEPTIILIDGLDHVWRVYKNNVRNLNKADVEILDALQKIKIRNPKVKLLVLSQPINELNSLPEFHQVELESWSLTEVEELMDKLGVLNVKILGDGFLSEGVLAKSGGNALYASYIIKWLNGLNKLSESILDQLPEYDFNLKSYYEYILRQIEQDKHVPLAFCGADFSLSLSDLISITGLGNKTEKHLKVLNPILNHNAAFGGYKIYHESFKRFMLENLKEDDVNIPQVVYQPIADWLSEQDFFKFRKASLYLFSNLFEAGRLKEIAEKIHPDFVQNSLAHGHPIAIIKANFIWQSKSLTAVESFEKMIAIVQQDKIINILSNVDTSTYVQYLLAINQFNGAQAMYDCIYNEGALMLETEKVYQLLKKTTYEGNKPNWGIIPKSKTMAIDDFDAILVKLLYHKKYEEIENLAKCLENNDKDKIWELVLINELKSWIAYTKNDSWLEEYPVLKKLISLRKKEATCLDLNENINRLLNIENSSDISERKRLINLIQKEAFELAKAGQEHEVYKSLDGLKDINWFYNWVQFSIRVILLKKKEAINFEKLHHVFYYLVRDLDKEKGKPRMYDLFAYKNIIQKSLIDGLFLCDGNIEHLEKCFIILQTVSDETTFHIQKSFSGPLLPEDLLDLQLQFFPPEKVIQHYTKELDHAKKNRLYNDLARMNFKLATVHVNIGNREKASGFFQEGIQSLTSYGDHKDRTLSDLLEGATSFVETFPSEGVKLFEELYRMSLTVVHHTNGKDTRYYPVEWYDKYFSLYPKRALAFLASEIIESNTPHWWEETQLLNTLKFLNGDCHPLLEFLILRTFPNSGEEKFFNAALSILNKIDDTHKDTVRKWFKSIISNAGNKMGTNGYSKELVDSISKELGSQFSKPFKIDEPYRNDENRNDKIAFKAESLDAALEQIEVGHIESFEPDSMRQFTLGLTSFSEKKYFILECLNQLSLEKPKLPWLEDTFVSGSDEWIFSQVACFVYRTDGLYHIMSYPDSFVRAYHNNAEKSIEYLKEILASKISSLNSSLNLMSANLLKGLSLVGVDKKIIKEIWNQTFLLINNRIPCHAEYDFNLKVDSFLQNLNKSELLVCILLSRIKGMTTERVQLVTNGLYLLAKETPELLSKPLIWFFNKRDNLSSLQLSIVMQILFDSGFYIKMPLDLKKSIEKLYPTNFYWTDFLIEQMLGKFRRRKLIEDEYIINLANTDNIGMMRIRHPRYRNLENYGVDLSLFSRDADDAMELQFQYLGQKYFNKTVETNVLTIKHAELNFDIFQSRFYNQFRTFEQTDKQIILRTMPLSIEEIVAQIGSRIERPSDLVLPSAVKEVWSIKKASKPQTDWIRLASVETEFHGEQFGKNNRHHLHQALVFEKDISKNSKMFSSYRLIFPLHKSDMTGFEFESTPICHRWDLDFFERINLLWLSPAISNHLGIKIGKPLYTGLNGVNEKEEKVLKFENWATDYIGGEVGGDEFPKITGGQLMIREDYYEKMLKMYPDITPQILAKNPFC